MRKSRKVLIEKVIQVSKDIGVFDNLYYVDPDVSESKTFKKYSEYLNGVSDSELIMMLADEIQRLEDYKTGKVLPVLEQYKSSHKK